MLLMTVQKKEIVEKIREGNYKANFWKSDYSCISPRYTKGYMAIKSALEGKLNVSLSESCSPMWAWVGYPYLDFHRLSGGDSKMVAMFIDIPENQIVFSDYDKYCRYIYDEGNIEDFIIPSISGIDLESSETCIQASFLKIEPSQIILTVDFKNFRDVELRSVQGFYNYWNLIFTYQRLKGIAG